MPFMVGRAPIRRTLKYLEAGKLRFLPEVRVLALNYNINQKSSAGAYEFQFWHFPQIKYKNDHLQLLKFKNMTPTPFIQIFLINGKRIMVDVHGKTNIEIHDHLLNTFCLLPEDLEAEKQREEIRWNPGGFGYHCSHWCICEYPGQVPCPAFVRNDKKRERAESN